MLLMFWFVSPVSPSSEGEGERAPACAPGGVAPPSHLLPRPGSDVGAADAAGGQTPRRIILS